MNSDHRLPDAFPGELECEELWISGLRRKNSAVLGCRWAVGNTLSVFPTKRSQEDEPGNAFYTCRLFTLLPSARTLITESHGVFLGLQRRRSEALELAGETASEGEEGQDARADCYRTSRHYRSLLRAQIIQLQASLVSDRTALGEQLSALERDECTQHVVNFRQAEIIWHLVEVMFISSSLESRIVTQQMIDWWQLHFTDASNLDQFQIPAPQQHPQYWSTLVHFVLGGHTREAAGLLQLHPRSQRPDEAPALVLSLLRHRPSLSSRYTLGDFVDRWKQWRADVRSVQKQLGPAAPGEPTDTARLRELVGLLAGDEALLRQRAGGSWLRHLLGYVVLVDPLVKAADLRELADRLVAQHGGAGALGPFDLILLDVLGRNVPALLKRLGLFLRSHWFVAHLCDLLQHCGQLPDYVLPLYELPLRDTLLLEYAEELLNDPGLFAVAADYLNVLPRVPHTQLLLHELLSRQPLDTEAKAAKLSALAERLELPDVARSIRVVMGMQCVARRRYRSAIHWLLLAKDPLRVSQLAKMLLRRHVEELSAGAEQDSLLDDLEAVVDYLGEQFVFSEKLVFLSRYREFLIRLRDRQLPAAGQLLVNMLSTKVAPHRFWLPLLRKAKPLLEAKEAIFSPADSFRLLECLEEVSLSHSSSEYLRGFAAAEITELRRSLSKTLARSFIGGASSSA